MPGFSGCIRRSVWVAMIAASCGLLAIPVQAGTVVDFDIDVIGGGGSQIFSDAGSPIDPTLTFYSGTVPAPSPDWTLTYSFLSQDDPANDAGILGAGFTVTNNLATNLQFSILITFDLGPSTALSYTANAAMTLNPGASDGTLSTTDAFGADLAMWTYSVNGSDFATLFNADYTLSANGVTNSDSAAIPATPISTVITQLGIRLVFDLSPGEIANFTGNFQFIPAPGALALLGLAGIMGRRRRR
ncbi:MAG: hypothetical protein L0Y44_08785 [Phycisphaerales bacterium]|nr:hypothetical protein [Phycisphaerales bacterium]MCI0630731.1 hypothetical protein [Phycisphaerales bacterium]MCI0676561.1 hypothetical protein [Phycisphaerales bacterium]